MVRRSLLPVLEQIPEWYTRCHSSALNRALGCTPWGAWGFAAECVMHAAWRSHGIQTRVLRTAWRTFHCPLVVDWRGKHHQDPECPGCTTNHSLA